MTARRRHRASVVNVGRAITRLERSVFGCGCRAVARPDGTPPCRDPQLRWRGGHINVAAADGKYLTDPSGRGEHDLDDLAELAVWVRAARPSGLFPDLDHGADRVDLCRAEGVGCPLGFVQPRDVVHRIAHQHLVAHRQSERQPQHRLGALGRRVGLCLSCLMRASQRATPISRSV